MLSLQRSLRMPRSVFRRDSPQLEHPVNVARPRKAKAYRAEMEEIAKKIAERRFLPYCEMGAAVHTDLFDLRLL